MKQALLTLILATLFIGQASAGTEGANSTFYGNLAGANNSVDSNSNTFIGAFAGRFTTSGTSNTFVGLNAGTTNTTGSGNAFFGWQAGTFTTTGSDNSFFGLGSGSSNTTGQMNTSVGFVAGSSNETGDYNTLVGAQAGNALTNGNRNTLLGYHAGASTTGNDNVFLGYGAGSSETGSNRLYIDNCFNGGACDSPLIYGEFNNHIVEINGVTHISANSVPRSQVRFSVDNTDSGGYLTSVLENNFFVSSGARYNGNAGGWIQRSSDGNAVMAGSGGLGYRIFTHTGGTVGNTFNNPTLRLQIDYDGQFGINTMPVPGDEIHTSSGAHLTAGGVWTDASSREYKENVKPLTTEQAMQAVAQLVPVTYNYKADRDEKHVGFIAEDVPVLVATKDRRSLSPMDIVAALTKVVQEQREHIAEQDRKLQQLADDVEQLKSPGK